MNAAMKVVTFEASPNIAVVKYWGKRNEKLILPTNSSISMTLDSLRTRTSVLFDAKLEKDELWLNGKQVDLENNAEAKERFKQLDVIRSKAGVKHRAHIVSINCFPTAAGFASSASGLAALACAASKAAGLTLTTKELSILARLGSGSATRSVMGGFVEWTQGKKADGSDSIAVQIAPAEHWPEMRLVSVVLDETKKKVSSRAGMKQTIATSALYKARMEYLPPIIKKMEEAIRNRNFERFAELTMQDSDNMHAVMLDTKPPIVYMNDKSHEIADAVIALNESNGNEKTIAAYTFDAGPNAHIYTTEENLPKVNDMLKNINGIKRTVVSSPGNGPIEITAPAEHLIDPITGKVRQHSFDEKTNTIIIA